MKMKMIVDYDPAELTKMREELQDSINSIIRDIADQILAESQVTVPVGFKGKGGSVLPGTLKKSGNVTHGRGYSFVGYNTPYAAPVHDGFDTHVQNVKPHMRNMKGVVVRVREHDRLMPARTGRPYLDDAIKKVLGNLDPSIRDMIEVVRVERLE